jgi:hypothetical protein
VSIYQQKIVEASRKMAKQMLPRDEEAQAPMIACYKNLPPLVSVQTGVEAHYM